MIYLDNAATTYPKPPGVSVGMQKAFSTYGANPGRAGHSMSIRTAEEVYKTRELVAQLFVTPNPENVIFTLNCTHALNIAIRGALRQGDHVIISDLEHNSVLRPVHAMAEAGIISYSIAKTVPGNVQQTLAEYERLTTSATRLYCCTQASNVFGIRLPVEELTQLAHSKGILMLVDAAQTAGLLDINLTQTPIDLLCMAGHKGLYGPTGTGVLIVSGEHELNPLTQGGTGSNSIALEQPDFLPDRLESGTVNTAGIFGLGQGVRFVLEQTPAKLYRHEMELCRQIYRCLSKNTRAVLYTPEPQMDEALPVLSFNFADYSGEETASKLSESGFGLRGGLHCSPLAHNKYGTLERGTCRISTGYFNNAAQLERLCLALQRL